MNKENSEKLIALGPTLFRNMERELELMAEKVKGNYENRPFYPIAFGFECGDGWFDILSNLISAIELECKNFADGVDRPAALQVKEKYGTLRFYLSHGNSKMFDLIHEAELKSAETCEKCGAPGKIVGEEWYSTLCPKCGEYES